MNVAKRLAPWPGLVLSGQSVRRADGDFGTCPTFHSLGLADHKLVRVSLRLANKSGRLLEVQYLLTRDKGLPGTAGNPD